MSSSKNAFYPMPLVFNLLCVVAIVCCVVLGLIGLILPIIPGFLFLFIAAVLLARISSRFESILNRNSVMSGWLKRWHKIKFLPVSQQIKLSLWFFAGTVIKGVESGVKLFKKTSHKD